jgi:hypothetical protein
VIVRENNCGTYENTVAEFGWLVDQRIILNLAIVTKVHTGADVGPATNDAVATDVCVLPHLRQVPDG